MRSQYEALTLLRRSAAELDPRRVNETLFERLKGGLPASSMSDGRGAAETPMPALDGTDQDLVALKDEYDRDLDKLATAAEKLVKRQRGWFAGHVRPAPKGKEFVRSELKAAADDYDREHGLDVGTTWEKQAFTVDGQTEKVLWCVSCNRVKGNLFPVADEKRGGKDCTLCRWCLDYVREHEQKWPPIEMIRARAEGRPVRVKVKPK